MTGYPSGCASDREHGLVLVMTHHAHNERNDHRSLDVDRGISPFLMRTFPTVPCAPRNVPDACANESPFGNRTHTEVMQSFSVDRDTR